MKKVLNVNGMSCNHCVSMITESLMKIDSVENVVIDLNEKTVEIDLSSAIENSILKEKIEDLGFDVE